MREYGLLLLLAVAPWRPAASAAADFAGAAARGAQGPAAPPAPPVPPAVAVPPRHDPACLERLLGAVENSVRGGGAPLILFDLDDTLLFTAKRQLRIAREFAALEEVRRAYPAEAALLARLTLADMRARMVPTAKAAGIADAKFLARLDAFWNERFFHNAYLTQDEAVRGGPEYVGALLSRGARIVYFTARWESARPGTSRGLSRVGYPAPDGKRVLLVMKSDKRQYDDDFKDAKLKEMASWGAVLGGFENEPRNVNLFKKRFPGALMIFLDTLHSGAAYADGRPIEPAPGIPWIKDFVR